MKTMINLLPSLCRRQQIVRKRTKQWSVVLCGVLAVGCLFHFRERSAQRYVAQRLEVLEREHSPTQTLLKQLVDMRQKLVDLQQQEAIANELEHQRNALALLGVISRTTQNTNGRLRVTKMELSNFQSADRAAGNGAQAGSLLVSGVSLDNPAVGELLDGLQDSGMFSRVVLNTLKEREGGDVSLRDYEVSCEF
jgi:Tfp pilus assembly protein PilN